MDGARVVGAGVEVVAAALVGGVLVAPAAVVAGSLLVVETPASEEVAVPTPEVPPLDSLLQAAVLISRTATERSVRRVMALLNHISAGADVVHDGVALADALGDPPADEAEAGGENREGEVLAPPSLGLAATVGTVEGSDTVGDVGILGQEDVGLRRGAAFVGGGL